MALLLLMWPVGASSAQQTGERWLFHVRKNGRCGYIDAQVTVIVEPQYDEACPYGDGLAAVRVRDRWGWTASPVGEIPDQHSCQGTKWRKRGWSRLG